MRCFDYLFAVLLRSFGHLGYNIENIDLKNYCKKILSINGVNNNHTLFYRRAKWSTSAIILITRACKQ